MFYVITFLVDYTGDSLGYYVVLVLSSRELFNYLIVCSQMVGFAINEDLIIMPT